jgi:hypothetical protein
MTTRSVHAKQTEGEHDLMQVRTDAEKYLMLATLNLVECFADAGATTSP